MTIVCGDSHTSHPRRLRGARFRHRHLRGRARAGHAVPGAEAAEDDADRVHGRARRGVTAKDMILAIIGRIGTGGEPATPSSTPARRSRASMEDRMTICNMTHRGRRPRGHDRARRDDVRVSRGPPGGADGLRRGGRSAGAAAHRRRRDASTREVDDRRRASSRRWSPGAPTRARSSQVDRRVPGAGRRD